MYHAVNGGIIQPYEYILYDNVGAFNGHPVMDIQYAVKKTDSTASKVVYRDGIPVMSVYYTGEKVPCGKL